MPKLRTDILDYFKGKLKPSKEFAFENSAVSGAGRMGEIIMSDQLGGPLQIIDTTPLTLGISVSGGIMCKIIPKGS
jgi:molecular chaperone DnaK (HSP70)